MIFCLCTAISVFRLQMGHKTHLVALTANLHAPQSHLRNVVIAGTGNLLVAVADKVFAGTFRVVGFDHKNLPFLAVFYRPESPSVQDYRMSFP